MAKPVSKNHTVEEIRALREYRNERYKNDPKKYWEEAYCRAKRLYDMVNAKY